MIIHLKDPAAFGTAVIKGCPFIFNYGTRYSIDVQVVWGTGDMPVDIGALGIEDWRVEVLKSIETPTEVLARETIVGNPFTLGAATFGISTATVEMYRYAGGAFNTPAVFAIKGYDGQDMAVCIQVPVLVKGSGTVQIPFEPSTALLQELQAGAAVAGAAMERTAALEQSATQAAADARIYADKLPVPSPDVVGKVPVVNDSGDGWDLIGRGQIEGLAGVAVNGEEAPVDSNKVAQLTDIAKLVDGKIPSENLPAMDYIPTAEKGAADGVAELDENGRVPSGELPAATTSSLGAVYIDTNGGLTVSTVPAYRGMVAVNPAIISNISSRSTNKPITPPNLNYAVTAALTDANHLTMTADEQAVAQTVLNVPGLDANGKVDRSVLPIAGEYSEGKVGGITVNKASNGIYSGILIDNTTGRVSLAVASTAWIDQYSGQNFPVAITLARLPYAVRSVLPIVTVIPDATTAYTLLDASATTNNHSMNYRHAPTSAPTYTLPNVADDAQLHEIVLNIRFSTSVQTYAFQDASGNPITPLDEPTLEDGTVVSFLCRYEPLLGSWCIMPVVLGTYTAQEG